MRPAVSGMLLLTALLALACQRAPSGEAYRAELADGGAGGGPGPSFCRDSDGNDPLVAGALDGYFASNSTSYSKRDVCVQSNRAYVEEYACLGETNYDSSWHDCGAFGCLNGRCNDLATSCKDSDGGYTPSTVGAVSGMTARGAPYTFADRCATETTLTEFYCDGAGRMAYETTLTCRPDFGGYLCRDGQCVPA